ncbi:MAG: carboxypeptidase regulatory-like domain-containing protein [Bacteroidota bacterium]
MNSFLRSAFVTALLASVIVLGTTGCKESMLGPDLTGRIEGRVLDFETQAPMAGASITTSPPTGALAADSKGRFIIEDVPTGNYTVTAVLAGFQRNSVSVAVREDQTTPAMLFLHVADSTDIVPTMSAEVTAFANLPAESDTVTVRVEYRVRNTGPVDIAAYEVYFRLETEGESFFAERGGENLKAGQEDIRTFQKQLFTQPAMEVVVDGTALDDQGAS